MPQDTINERIKFLIETLGMSARGFSMAIGSSDTNTRNYLDRGSKPGAEYLEKILLRFEAINGTWLLTGKGEPFLPNGDASVSNNAYVEKISGSVGTVGTSHGPTTMNINNLDTCKARLDVVVAENEGLRAQVENLTQLVASKEETLTLMRIVHNRPN